MDITESFRGSSPYEQTPISQDSRCTRVLDVEAEDAALEMAGLSKRTFELLTWMPKSISAQKKMSFLHCPTFGGRQITKHLTFPAENASSRFASTATQLYGIYDGILAGSQYG